MAADVEASLAKEPELRYSSIQELSLGIRALLASGTTTRIGPHHEVLRRALDRLESLLPKLRGPRQAAARATALAGYLEGVLVTGGKRLRVLAAECSDFLRQQKELYELVDARAKAKAGNEKPSVSDEQEGHQAARPEYRPLLGSWSSSLDALVDAAVILRIAPALGLPVSDAKFLRKRLFDHVLLRSQEPGLSGAAAKAGLLFAWPDFVDRETLLRTLHGYRLDPERFASNVRSLRYLAWGAAPVRAGFARFNQAIRSFVANHEPESSVERSCLLLIQLFYLAPYFD